MAALNAQANAGKKWSGYKGDIEVYCGGHECRHGWDWVSSSMLLRSRPDLEMVPGKGPFKVRYKAGFLPQQMSEAETTAAILAWQELYGSNMVSFSVRCPRLDLPE